MPADPEGEHGAPGAHWGGMRLRQRGGSLACVLLRWGPLCNSLQSLTAAAM